MSKKQKSIRLRGKAEFLQSFNQIWLEHIVNANHKQPAEIIQILLTHAAANLVMCNVAVFIAEHALEEKINCFKKKNGWSDAETKSAHLLAFNKIVELAIERGLIKPA